MSTASAPSQQQPQANPDTMVPQSTLASASLIKSGGAKDTNNGTNKHTASGAVDAEFKLVRRSSHHYEHDLARYLIHAGESQPKSPTESTERIRFHQRRESFNREDQKHFAHLYMMADHRESKTGNFTEA